MELIEKDRSMPLPQLNLKYKVHEEFRYCIVLKDFQNQEVELKSSLLYIGELYLGAKFVILLGRLVLPCLVSFPSS